jgi:hypothetical protein
MLFRPQFCANCGERIDRTDWTILTSRRFCPVCETQFKGEAFLYRGIVLGALTVGLFGVGVSLREGKQAAEKPVQVARLVAPPDKKTQDPPESPTNDSAIKPGANALQPRTQGPPPSQQRPNPSKPPTKEEAVYFCGAATKKGTPCSRRVKGNTRCYQHIGMPAMTLTDQRQAGMQNDGR